RPGGRRRPLRRHRVGQREDLPPPRRRRGGRAAVPGGVPRRGRRDRGPERLLAERPDPGQDLRRPRALASGLASRPRRLGGGPVTSIDWRLPQYRREAFLRFFLFEIDTKGQTGNVYSFLPAIAAERDLSPDELIWLA